MQNSLMCRRQHLFLFHLHYAVSFFHGLRDTLFEFFFPSPYFHIGHGTIMGWLSLSYVQPAIHARGGKKLISMG
jgi:hypothetical protein